MPSKYNLWLAGILLLSFMPVFAFNQIDPEKVINQLIQKRAEFESVTYHIDFKMKLFSRPDTVDFLANVELVRKPEDTLFHGLVLIDMDTVWYGYDGEKIFARFLNTNEVIYDNALTTPGLFIKSNFRNNLVDDGFLQIKTGLKQVINTPEYHPEFVDTVLDGVHCIGLYFSTPDNGEFTDYHYFTAIDPDSLFLRKIVYSVYFQGNEQYQEWNYSNVKFGHESSIPRLDFKTFGSNIKETHYVRNKVSDDIPDFEWSSLKGKIFNSDEWIVLKNLGTKYIILDFWYTSCYPCIKSIPAVRDISNRYDTSEVKVIGVNMIDDEADNKSRLEKFFVNNPMPYPTIMLDNATYREKLPLSFPTFLILNDRYEVVFQETGFDETLFQKATQFLDKGLNK